MVASLSKTLLEEYNCMALDLEKKEEEEESELAKKHLVHKKTCKNYKYFAVIKFYVSTSIICMQ
jgi:hypothetical protein